MCFKTEPTLTVVECHCSCEVGLSQSCHHLIGLAFYLQDLVLRGEQQLLEPTASTSMPMKWNIPRGTKVMPENVTNISFGKPSKLIRKKNPISYKLLRPKTTIKSLCSMSKQERLTKFTKTVKKLDETIPLSYLIDPNDTDESMTVLAIQTKTQAIARDVVDKLPVELPILNLTTTNILISLPLPDEDRFLKFTMDDAKTLEAKTRLQGTSKEWHQNRKFIFTSSNFGMLCKRTKAFGREFFDNLWVEKDLGHVRSLEHGRKEEKNARELYEKTTKNKCNCCGLIIHPYAPYLGTSPDGIVVTQSDIGLVEFKCPYGSKSGTLKEALKQKNFHLKENDNELVPNKKHNYYYQVQGQMLITGLKWCDLCTYFKNNNEICIVRIPFNEAFCYEMFDKLTEMYNVYLSL